MNYSLKEKKKGHLRKIAVLFLRELMNAGRAGKNLEPSVLLEGL